MLRRGLHYLQRNARWPIILWQCRGVSARDKISLLLSAFMAPLLSLRDLDEWQDPILLRDAEVDVPGFGRFACRARSDDLWHVLPFREKIIATAMSARLRPGDVFIDAGANIGVYTVLGARLVGPSGLVISIEMMPDTAQRLHSHIELNGLQNVVVVRAALSDEAGLTVKATVQQGKYGQATISSDAPRYGVGEEIEVVTTTLDSIARDVKRPRMMKIDIEGAEFLALKGAPELLKRLEAIVYESWNSDGSGTNPVGELLERNGFVLEPLDGNNWIALRVLSE